MSNFDDGDAVGNGDLIIAAANGSASQDWYVYLPPNVDSADITIGGFRYYDVIGFDILYYDTQLSVAVGEPTVAGGSIPNVPDAGDIIPILYTMENTGDVTVLNPTVTDPDVPAVVYDSGDTDGDGELDPDEAWVFRGEYTITGDVGAGTDYSQIFSTVDDGSSVTSSADPLNCNDVGVGSEVPRVFEVPSEPVAINLEKCIQGTATDFSFNITNLNNATQTHSAPANACSALVTEYVTDVDEPVVIEEVLPLGWDLLDATCTNASGESLSGTTLTIPVSDLTPGNDITCTFTNRERVAL